MRDLVVYSGLYAGSAGLLKMAGFVLFLWLARTLSVDDYANFGLLYALQTGLMTFGLVGIVEAVVGLLKEHRTSESQRGLFAAANGAFLVTLATSLVVILSIYKLFLNHSGPSLLLLACVLASGGLLAYSSLQAQVVRLEEKHLSSLCFNFVLPFCGLLGGFVVSFVERKVQSFFLGSAIGLLLAGIVLWSAQIGFYGMSGRLVEIRPILLRTIPFLAVAFLGWLSGYGNNYVVNFFFESKEVAKFTFALGLSSVMQLIATALNQVWSPRFYQLIQHTPFEQVEDKNQRFFRLQSIAMGILGGIVIAVFPSAMMWLGGNLAFYQSMSLELVLLFAAYVLLCPWWHCSNYLLAYDKGSTLMKVTITTSALGILTWIVLIWLLGPIGIYVGFLAQMLLRTIGIWFKTRQSWPIRVSWGGVAVGILLISGGFALSKILFS